MIEKTTLRQKEDIMYEILKHNPQLMPYAGDIELRMELYRQT